MRQISATEEDISELIQSKLMRAIVLLKPPHDSMTFVDVRRYINEAMILIDIPVTK